jgi:hypothetical protein
MKYEKPEITAVASAAAVIHNPCGQKTGGHPDSCDSETASSAYAADE